MMSKQWTEETLRQSLVKYHDTRYSWSNLDKTQKPSLDSLRKAAVLIPLFIKDNDIHVWLTKRSDKVSHDRGHVSFPGGMKDEEDVTAVDTSLREAQEEIGLERNQVDIVIELLPRLNARQILITPIVGIVCPDFIPVQNSEVEIPFHLPLSRFLRKEAYHNTVYSLRGRDGTIHFFTDTYDGTEVITWGLTASICIELSVGLYQKNTEFEFTADDAISYDNPFGRHEAYLKSYEKNLSEGKVVLGGRL